METTYVPFSKLQLRSEFFQNPRTQSGLEESEIRELAFSIAWHGLLNPLRVTVDHVILAGQRRYLAITYLNQHAREIADVMGADPEAIVDRALRLYRAVPVIVDHDGIDAGVAMADNLARVDLSSYEIAAEIARMSAGGDSGTRIAMRISKSPAYVSKALKAWRGAGAALKEAWRIGAISYDRVKELADLHEEDQERAVHGAGAPRGGHGRPGIEAVKDALVGAARRYADKAAPHSYATGVMDALRWVSGQTSSSAFAEFMESIE
jgi:ParB-like chromosome segregation protein Spo0J